MGKIFISYSRQDVDEVLLLSQELKARGLCLWQDVSDLALGYPTEEQIRSSLAEECDAFLVYLTPQSLNSRFVMRVELVTALGLRRQNPDFAVIPVFRRLSLEEANAATLKQAGENITSIHGVVIKGPDADTPAGLRTQLGTVARMALHASVKRHQCQFQDNPDRMLNLHLHTRQYTRFPEAPDLDLDWRAFFEAVDAPSHSDCEITLLPALHQIKETCAAILGLRTVRVRGKAHLTAGAALGFVSRATTGFHLQVEQGSSEWCSRIETSDTSPLLVLEKHGEIHSDEIAVEVSVTLDVAPGVDRFVMERGPFRMRLALQPAAGPGRDSVRDGAHAQAMAKQVGHEIRRVCGEYQASKIHLFLATPLSLAILIGHQLNACGPVQTYEYSNERREYVPSFLLK